MKKIVWSRRTAFGLPALVALLLSLPFLMGAGLPDGLSLDDNIPLENDIQYLGLTISEEVAGGDELRLSLYFASVEPVGAAIHGFAHIQSVDGDCRIVHDEPIVFEDGTGVVEIRHTVPNDCPPQRLEVYVGLYNHETGHRFELGVPTLDDRIHAGWVNLVDTDPSAELRLVRPSSMRFQRVLQAARPWFPWASAIVLSLLLFIAVRVLVARTKSRADTDDAEIRNTWMMKPVEPKSWANRISLWLLFVPLLATILVLVNFVKDDAYISFRYAHNLAVGEGMVFNPGEHLEGYTNFLWVLIMVPFEALGADLFQVCEILGTALAFATLFQLSGLAVYIGGRAHNMSHLWAAVWLATSSSLGLWATSGLEQPLATLLPVASVFAFFRADSDKRPKLALISGLVMGLGCMTRPEIHLVGIIVALPLVVRVIKNRRLDRVTRNWMLGLLAITAPCHLFRFFYYGELLPNTFLVKSADSTMIIFNGFEKLREMFDFNNLGLFVVLAPFAFLDKSHRKEKLVALAIAGAFMAYVVKVGVDEMTWHRLYLPALPFLLLLGANGLANICRLIIRSARRIGTAVFILAWAAVLVAATANFVFSYESKEGFNGRGELSGNFHPDIGKFLTRHERAEALVAFQDMGSTPYHAPDINFLDFIGLTDQTVARSLREHGLSPFTATEGFRNRPIHNANMRDYFHERSPEWAILTTYVRGDDVPEVSRAFDRDPTPVSLEPFTAQNGHHFGVYDERFRDRYVHVRTWRRAPTYYLSLFRRRDLWEQIPREVVFDRPPANLAGVQATLDRGLVLLGSEMETEAPERHEIFVTTWWRLPGPLEPDIYFFIHVEGGEPLFRWPNDHAPGDSMYPADRWREGDVLEDRVLVQLPINMGPGTYELYIGAYRRSTGERLDILEGPDDGRNRLHLGTVTVRPRVPLFDHLIPPTDIDEQRLHADRITDSGRRNP